VKLWYHDRLRDGELIETFDDSPAWADQPLHVQPSAITKAYADWMQRLNPRAVVSYRALLTELKEFGWDGGDHCREPGGTRARYWLVPRLRDARAIFSKKIGIDMFPED